MTPACYTAEQIAAKLQMGRRTFYKMKKAGLLPFLEELRPRLGRIARYRADLVDRYIDGKWGPRAFRKSA